jgi:ParB-like chromosome segregation protein Spo0J
MVKRRSPSPDPRPPSLDHIAESLRPLAAAIAELRTDPHNARKHDERNLKSIAASLRQFGQVKPIVVNRKTRIIEAGNGTYEAARQLGWTHLAVVYVAHDAKAARGFSLADNRTAELADWDAAILETLLAEVQADSPDLYDELLLAELRSSDESPESRGAGQQTVEDRYSVVVECRDEADQEQFYQRMQKEKRPCRLLTL